MKKTKIAFIDSLDNDIAYSIYDHIKGIAGDNVELVHVKANGDLPQPADTIDWIEKEKLQGLIFSGSTYSVNDDIDWINNQYEFTKSLLSDNAPAIPCLGLCFGHQMLAKAAGAPIGHVEETIKGIKRYEIARDSPLFQDISGDFETFVYHNDTVDEIPDRFNPLIQDQGGYIRGMKHTDKPVFSLQSHPEAPYEVVNLFDSNIEAKSFPDVFGDTIIKNFTNFTCEFSASE